jgi:ABC-2 type transport system permease protein
MKAFLSLSRTLLRADFRDRTWLFFTLVFPLMFLLLFGALLRGSGASHVTLLQVGPVGVLDHMSPTQRAELGRSVTVVRVDSLADAISKVTAGTDDGVVTQTGPGQVELRFSVADPTQAATVQGLVDAVVQQANVAATGRPPAWTLTTAQVEDHAVKPIQYLTPGLLGWAIATSGTFSAALTLVTWRRKRILRRLRLSPISLTAIVAAPAAVTLTVALLQTAVFLAVATLPYYGLRLTGHWWISLPLVLTGSIAFMSIGLLTGSWAKTENAAQSAGQLIVLPMAFLSGAFFPLDNSPGWVRAVAQLMPLHHLATAMEDVLSRDEGWSAALPTMGGLLLFAAVLCAISVRLFRWDDT